MHIIISTKNLFVQSVRATFEDNVPQMAAALSYYALFALPAILMLTVQLLNMFLSTNTAQNELVAALTHQFGDDVKIPITQILNQVTHPSSRNIGAQLLGFAALLIASTGVLGHIQRSLNVIWKLNHSRRAVRRIFEQRMWGIIFIVSSGFLIFVSMIISAIVRILYPYLTYTTAINVDVVKVLYGMLSWALFTVIIAVIFRYIPSGKVAWRDIWVGALVTSTLFSLGKYLVTTYLTYIAIGSAYGTAGSIILLMFWIYYSALIFFFGAEFTHVYAHTHGKGIQTHTHAS